MQLLNAHYGRLPVNSERNKGNPVGWVRRVAKGLGSGTKLYPRRNPTLGSSGYAKLLLDLSISGKHPKAVNTISLIYNSNPMPKKHGNYSAYLDCSYE